MNIIIGSGEKVSVIASKLSDSLIVDRNPESAANLEFKGFNVLNADASDAEILSKFDTSSRLILADDDEFNLKVARVAKTLGFEDIVAISSDESKCSIYDREGVKKICNTIDNLLNLLLERDRYIEIPVGSEFEGMELKEFDPGEDCTVVSVFRDGKVLQPHPEMIVQKGDTLGVICGEEVRVSKNPFNAILILERGQRDDEIVVEAEMLAKRFSASIIVFQKKGNAYACNLRGYSDKIELEEAIDILKKSDELDLIVTSLEEKNEGALKNLVSKFPTLLVTGRTDYRKILAIANSKCPDKIINMAKAFSRFFGNVKVLLLEKEQLKHFSKFTETELEVKVSEGNPMVDAIKEFKSGYDLTILSIKNDLGNIDRDILWKMILDKNTSVLVVD